MAPPKKLSQNQITRQSKPYIDQNLQIELPEHDTSIHPSPIYSHFIGSSPSSFKAQAEELTHIMKEAELSFNAWKKMEQQLKNAVIAQIKKT